MCDVEQSTGINLCNEFDIDNTTLIKLEHLSTTNYDCCKEHKDSQRSSFIREGLWVQLDCIIL